MKTNKERVHEYLLGLLDDCTTKECGRKYRAGYRDALRDFSDELAKKEPMCKDGFYGDDKPEGNTTWEALAHKWRIKTQALESIVKVQESKLEANEKIMDEAGEDMARLDEQNEGLKMENKKLILMLKLATKDHTITEERLNTHDKQLNELIYAVKDMKEELIESGNLFEYKKGEIVAWNGAPTTILKIGDKGMYTGLDNRGCHVFIFRVDGNESHVHYSQSYWTKNRLNIVPATHD